MCCYVSEFTNGPTSTSDKPRIGRPQTVTNDEMVDEIHDIELADLPLKPKERCNGDRHLRRTRNRVTISEKCFVTVDET